MFGTLFFKECKQMLHSMIYIVYLLIMVAFLVSQLGDTMVVKEPQPNQKYYGEKVSTNKTNIMGKALANLVDEIENGGFATYPVGFYKRVKVTSDKLEKLKSVVEECTGKSWNQIEQENTAFYEQFEDDEEGYYAANSSHMVLPSQDLKYSDFKLRMKQVCEIIGRGSSYEKSHYENMATEPMTYEDALKEYQAICQKDGITGAFMRLFCDYAGILLAIMPIFLGVTRCVRDKRANAAGVIFSKKASSMVIVMSRYLANIVMMFIPILIIAFIMQGSYIYQANTLGITPHYFAFFYYSVMWLLPEIMFVTAFAFFLSELFNGIVAIVIQMFYGMVSLMQQSGLLEITGLNLIPRWNTFGETTSFLKNVNQLYSNRLFHVVVAIVIILLTVIVYGFKRRGGALHGKKH